MRIDTQGEFGTRECPSCGVEVEANHNRCPLCGYLFPLATPRQRHMRRWGALLMLGLLIYLYVLLFV